MVVLHVSDSMASTGPDRRVHAPIVQHCQHHVDHVQTVEEYVLDERDFNPSHLSNMPHDRRNRSVKQQRHVRRSAELRTVSIIETLSELVAGQGERGLDCRHDACDGRCQSLVANGRTKQPTVDRAGQERWTRPSACSCHCLAPEPSFYNEKNVGFAVGPHLKCCEASTCAAAADCGGNESNRELSANVRPRHVRCMGRQHSLVTAVNGDSSPGQASSCVKNETIGTKEATCPNSHSRFTLPKMGKVYVHSEKAEGRGMVQSPNVVTTLNAARNNSIGLSHLNQCTHSTHDPAHFMLSTLKSKGRTPDWIAGIFSIARRGNLDRLSQALVDMDATLIRNLSDHRGNNLFHVCCCYGHLDCLQWLMQRGKQCEDAILDENKYELTPLVCAVKYGKLPCVEWLIRNTVARGQLIPSSGSRPLLHWAAKYGQEVILRWLAEYMENNTMDVNVKDGYGNTALHLAAKHGHAVCIKALVIHRSNASLKNDLGYKASDYAVLYGQTACSEYLLSLEACLLLSSDVASLDADMNSSRAEMSEMKTQFKDVLSCTKKLVKEREELSQHLDRLQDGLVHLNDVIISEIQALCEQNAKLREKVDGRRQDGNSQSLDETIALCHAMQTRWKDGQQRWLSPNALADIQQKILLAEERWKRARARANWGDREGKEHMTVFRERLAQAHCRTTGIRLSEIRSISSSESSLASMEDALSDYEERYELPKTTRCSSPPHLFSTGMSGVDSRNCIPTSAPFSEERRDVRSTQSNCATADAAKKGESTVRTANSNPGYSGESSPFKSIRVAQRSQKEPNVNKSVSSVETRVPIPNGGVGQRSRCGRHPFLSDVGLVSQGTCKVLEVIVSSDNDCENDSILARGTAGKVGSGIDESEQPWTTKKFSEAVQSEILNAVTVSHAAEFSNTLSILGKKKSTTTRGDCKSELLEYKNNDRGDDDEDDKEGESGTGKSDPNTIGRKDKVEFSLDTCGNNHSCTGGKVNQAGGSGNCVEGQEDILKLFEEFEMSTPNLPTRRAKSPSLDNSGKLVSSEPDLIIGTKGIRTNPTNLKCVPPESREPRRNEETKDASSKPEDCILLSKVDPLVDRDQILASESEADLAGDNEEVRSGINVENVVELHLVGFDVDETRIGLVARNSIPMKRRGFLQKLHLRWPSKRKGKSPEKSQEISPENFRETYLLVRNGSCDDDKFQTNQDGAAAGRWPPTAPKSFSNTVSAGSGNSDPADSIIASGTESCPRRETNSRSLDDDKVVGGIREINSCTSSSRSSTKAALHIEANVGEIMPSLPKGTRDVPIPPLPPMEVLADAGEGSLNCPNDVESASQNHNDYGYILMPSSASNEGVQRSDCIHDEDGDEQFSMDANKESCRPEADQSILSEEDCSRIVGEDDCSLIHARAGMPPQRPVSRGSKSDHSFASRPESSASRTESYLATYRFPGYPLRKASSVSTDLHTPGSLTPSRMSPAPSEASKTESALSPPSDISKTESMRHTKHLARIEEMGKREAMPIPTIPMKLIANVKVAAIVDINHDTCTQKLLQQDKDEGKELAIEKKISALNLMEVCHGHHKDDYNCKSDKAGISVTQSITTEHKIASKEKPWYELSDDEEILMPETLRRDVGKIVKGTSEEDVYLCT